MCKDNFSNCPFQQELIVLCDEHEDIAWVVYFHNSNNSVKWMKAIIPVLNGKSPQNCFPDHIEFLKKVLLSFPY